MSNKTMPPSEHPSANSPLPSAETNKPVTLAKTAEADLFLDILRELQVVPRRPSDLQTRVIARNPARPVSVEVVEDVARELRGIGWLEWAPNEARKLLQITPLVPPAVLAADVNAYTLHLELALAHESCGNRISQLLKRLFALAPERQGALVLPEPEVQAPADVRELPVFLQTLMPQWINKFAKEYPHALLRLPKPTHVIATAIEKELVSIWPTLIPSARNRRILEKVRDRFALYLFEGVDTTPRELIFSWMPRLAYAGLWMWARRLYGIAGIAIFPVGTFLSAGGSLASIKSPTDFRPVTPNAHVLQNYFLHDPLEDVLSFADQFTHTLFAEVEALRQGQREYVSLLDCRDRVCYRLRIGHPIFERQLSLAVQRSVARQINYTLSVEPDQTWEEQTSRELILPVMMNGPRFIISMSERK